MLQGKHSEDNELTEFRQSEIRVIVDAAMNEKFKGWKRTITFFCNSFSFCDDTLGGDWGLVYSRLGKTPF